MSTKVRSMAGVLVVSTLFHGCATMIFQNPEDVTIRSNVPALVKDGAAILGKTPVIAHLDRGKDHIIRFEADGCDPKAVELRSEFSWWRAATSVVLNGGHGIFTLFITTALGIGIDIASGSWCTLGDCVVDADLARPTIPTTADAPDSGSSPAISETPEPPSRALAASAPVVTRASTATPAPVPAASATPSAPPAPGLTPTAPSAATFCSHCGAHLASGAAFCSACGSRVGGAQ